MVQKNTYKNEAYFEIVKFFLYICVLKHILCMVTKSEDTREHILNVAFELFLHKGYKEVTMSELEKATGLTKGAFYHHFKDKLEIFEAAISEKTGKMRFHPDNEWLKRVSLWNYIEAYVAHNEKVARYLFNNLSFNYADLQFTNIISDVINYMPGFKENLIKITAEEINIWESVIFRAKENNEIRGDVETTALAYTFSSITNSLQKNLIICKSLQYSLSIIQLQFEQLYALIKI